MKQISTKKERSVFNSALPNLFERGGKTRAADVSVGSLVLAQFHDDHCGEDEYLYDLLIVYRVGKKVVRCANVGNDYINHDDFELKPDQEVVVLVSDPGMDYL